jgi:glycosyltransferase involved in cell wall biosynthesis
MNLEPYHTVLPAGPDPGRRLLLVSYHFPPAQTAGALRWQKLAPFLAQQGWGLDVISHGPVDLTDQALTELDSLPPGTRLYWVRRRPSIEEKLERKLVGLRKAIGARWRRAGSIAPPSVDAGAGGNRTRPSSIPPDAIRWQSDDGRAAARAIHSWLDFSHFGTWVSDVTKLGTQLASRQSYGMIATSGPPHLAHAAGVAIASAAAAPLMVDFRDPWSLRRRLPEPIASPVWFWLARRHERRIIRRAALIVTNTDVVRDELGRLYPDQRGSMVTVMNGSDEDPVPDRLRQERFVVAYAGGIYLDRNPRTFFRGAATMVRQLELTPDQFQVLFIGDVQRYGGLLVMSMAEEEGLGGYVTLRPSVPRSELLEQLASAAMLLSLPQDSRYAIPSKVFEYMQFEAWVLALAKSDSPTAMALDGTEADVVDPDQPDAIADALRRRYLQFAGGERPSRPDPQRKLSRKRQAMILLDAMETVLSATAKRSA